MFLLAGLGVRCVVCLILLFALILTYTSCFVVCCMVVFVDCLVCVLVVLLLFGVLLLVFGL